MGLPVARLRVVMTGCSLSIATGPRCFHALPISSKKRTTLGERRPSCVGGAFKIRLHCLRFSGSSQSSTTVVTALRCPSASRCFQNHSSVRVTQDRAGTLLPSGTFCPAFLLESLHIGIIEPARRILTGIEITDQAVWLQVLDLFVNLLKRHLILRDAAPRSIPAVGDEDVDLAITSE